MNKALLSYPSQTRGKIHQYSTKRIKIDFSCNLHGMAIFVSQKTLILLIDKLNRNKLYLNNKQKWIMIVSSSDNDCLFSTHCKENISILKDYKNLVKWEYHSDLKNGILITSNSNLSFCHQTFVIVCLNNKIDCFLNDIGPNQIYVKLLHKKIYKHVTCSCLVDIIIHYFIQKGFTDWINTHI